MKKRGLFNSGAGFIMIFAIFFLIPVILLGTSFTDDIKYRNVLENGIEAEATILKSSSSSNITINEVDYYSIGYVFLDENGEEHRGRTSATYDYYEISKIAKNETIKIKYLPDTFESVECDYGKNGMTASSGVMLIVIIFGVVDGLLWIAAIVTIVKEFKKRAIGKKGTEYTATFMAMTSNVKVNNVPRYAISYFWKDEKGEIHEDKSGHDFSYKEALAYSNAGTFKIRAIGEDSVITSRPSKLLYQLNKTEKQLEKSEQFIRCPYCNSRFEKSNTKCPYCGAHAPEEQQ